MSELSNGFYAAALFVRKDSLYKKFFGVDCYDADRDARTFKGGLPVIAHPPCRAWGVLSHMANPEPGERDLAFFAVEQVQKNGGVLEHPSGSRLWKEAELPEPGELPNLYGGFSILINQYDFGHVASKPTKLYICGIDQTAVTLPLKRAGTPAKSMTGQVYGTTRCTQSEREYTPEPLMRWLLSICLKRTW